MWRALKSAAPFLGDPAPVVGVLRLEGVIGGRGRGLTLAGLEKPIARAFAGEPAAVALQINSPGGSPVQSRLIHDRIRARAEEDNVPVYVFCEDLAASGGYMLACAGDEIFADASSIVGSIGVVGAGFGFVEALEKLGVERRVYAQGENKVRLDPFRPEKPDDVAFADRLQKALHEEFIALVTARRGKLLDASQPLFDGDVHPGRKALALGLIDGLGHMREVLRERFGPRVRLRRVPVERRGLARAFVSGAVDETTAVVEERALRARYGL